MRCPKCNSTQTKIKEYTDELGYMGTWIHCRYCGQHTPMECPHKIDNPLTYDKKPKVCSLTKPMLPCKHERETYLDCWMYLDEIKLNC